MLVRLAARFEDDFLWAGTPGRDPLVPRDFSGLLEERERARNVNGPASQVERSRHAAHLSIATSSATAAGDAEARTDPQETEGMSSGMGDESAEEKKFTSGASAGVHGSFVDRSGDRPGQSSNPCGMLRSRPPNPPENSLGWMGERRLAAWRGRTTATRALPHPVIPKEPRLLLPPANRAQTGTTRQPA